MSARGWTGSVAAAIGLAAATGAAQLGIGYGLGAIGWLGDAGGWAAALTWTIWVAALSVVVAALLARRRALAVSSAAAAADSSVEGVEGGSWGRGLWRAAVACAAALGGLAVVPLTALPAREVSTASTFAPAWTVGWYAAVGVLIGMILAVLALSSRAIAANIIATGSWWWLVAVVTVLDAVAAGRGLVPTQLGVWRFTTLTGSAPDGEVDALGVPGDGWWHSLYIPGAVLIILSALVIGFFAATPAARRGDALVRVALSGLIGPGLFALASVLGAPRLGGAPVEQLSTLLVAPYAVVAGLAGSVIAVLVFGPRRPSVPRPRPVRPATVSAVAAVPAAAKASSVDKPMTPRQARNDEARDRAARDAEARQAAAQAARASGGTATAVATAPVETGGAHKASESGWRRKQKPGAGSDARGSAAPKPSSSGESGSDTGSGQNEPKKA